MLEKPTLSHATIRCNSIIIYNNYVIINLAYLLDELAERIRGESELYMEIPDNLTSNKRRKNSSLWRKQSPYLDMRGSKDSSDMAKTLPR